MMVRKLLLKKKEINNLKDIIIDRKTFKKLKDKNYLEF